MLISDGSSDVSSSDLASSASPRPPRCLLYPTLAGHPPRPPPRTRTRRPMTTKQLVPVFDIGGVFLGWNPRHLYRKLFDDEAAMEHFLATVCTSEWNLLQDAGRGWAEAVEELTGRFPEHAELIDCYDTRWEEMIPRIFEGTGAILEELQDSGPVRTEATTSEIQSLMIISYA